MWLIVVAFVVQGCAAERSNAPVRALEEPPPRPMAETARLPDGGAAPSDAEPEGDMMCHAEARFSGCWGDEQPCETYQVSVFGRGTDRSETEVAAERACRERLTEIWRTGPWPQVMLDLPCRALECGLSAQGGRPPRAQVRLARLRRRDGSPLPADDEVRRVLARALEPLTACYQRRLEVEPLVEGRLSFDLRVDGDGRVTEVRTEGGEGLAPSLLACLVGHLGVLRFPPGESVLELSSELRLWPLILLNDPVSPSP